jgi:hypothetical protein
MVIAVIISDRKLRDEITNLNGRLTTALQSVIQANAEADAAKGFDRVFALDYVMLYHLSYHFDFVSLLQQSQVAVQQIRRVIQQHLSRPITRSKSSTARLRS